MPELGGQVVAEAIRRAGIDPADVEEVATGVNLPGADRSIARQVLIEAGIPTESRGVHGRPGVLLLDGGDLHGLALDPPRRREGSPSLAAPRT